jgi:hypothetical protein
MQDQNATATLEPQTEASRESLYRTKWLIAHNRLHDIVHGKAQKPLVEVWKEYLNELQTAEEVAARPA